MLMKCINSGSSGNGYALISDDEVLLIECGVPSKEMLRAIDYQTSKVAGYSFALRRICEKVQNFSR